MVTCALPPLGSLFEDEDENDDEDDCDPFEDEDGDEDENEDDGNQRCVNFINPELPPVSPPGPSAIVREPEYIACSPRPC